MLFLMVLFVGIYGINPECISDSMNITSSQCDISSTLNGNINCNNEISCCNCDIIECTQCNQLNCNGKRSCVNTPIDIIGGITGAILACNGLESCSSAKISATNIISLKCGGIQSCKDATLSLSTNIGTLLVNCDNDYSCDGTSITASNVEQINCNGPYSCRNSHLLLHGFDLSINFNGIHSALGSTITASNVVSFGCNSDFACSQSEFESTCSHNGCIVTCKGEESCYKTIFKITNSFGVQCHGKNACNDAIIYLNNNVGGSIKCFGDNGCRGLIVNDLANIDSIICSGRSTCIDGIISASCNNNIGCNVLCQDVGGCTNTNITATNVRRFDCDGRSACSNINTGITPFDNTFEITATKQSAASDGTFTVKITNNNINSIKGIRCDSDVSACLRSVFIIDASGVNNIINIDNIICSGVGACLDTVFILINAQIYANNFKCIDSNSCVNTVFICQDKFGNPLNNTCITNEIPLNNL